MEPRTTFDASDLVSGLDDYASRLRRAILEAGEIIAKRIESYAKKAAIWTDRTTNARSGLVARATLEGTRLVIILAHTMAYGLWLEVANAGKYAIVMKALEANLPMAMALIRAVLGG